MFDHRVVFENHRAPVAAVLHGDAVAPHTEWMTNDECLMTKECPAFALLQRGRPNPNAEDISGDFHPGHRDGDAIAQIQFRMRRMMRASLPILFSLIFR